MFVSKMIKADGPVSPVLQREHTASQAENSPAGEFRSPALSAGTATTPGRWVCVTRSGGSIHDLRSYNLNDQTRSLKINRNDCG
ncbi:hypothetical protein FE633_12810 [Streptomyces montanus]|uniref:Uncharacterized protein n=1 Tax=Streptomyces montanus TaxID=2580423 RepID=A0A5R9FXX4_9ACTN|nr:hypothetical protein FE633_12810 [Streptomyces montanus]